MCNSSTCPNNKSGIGADFMCRCKESDYPGLRRVGLSLSLNNAINNHPLIVSYYWTILAEYFTHE